MELFAFPGATTRTELDCRQLHVLVPPSVRKAWSRPAAALPTVHHYTSRKLTGCGKLSVSRTAHYRRQCIYSYIMMVRLDYTFTLPVIQWVDTEWSRFNFLSKCERHCGLDTPLGTCSDWGDDPPRCVNDILYTMARAYFIGFDLATSKPPFTVCEIWDGVKQCNACFRGGHGAGLNICYNAIEVAIRMTSGNMPLKTRSSFIGFVAGWRPQINIREGEWPKAVGST